MLVTPAEGQAGEAWLPRHSVKVTPPPAALSDRPCSTDEDSEAQRSSGELYV